MQYAVAEKPCTTIYEIPSEVVMKDGITLSAISDEALYGMGLCITGAEENGFYPVRTFYGYYGYVHADEVRVTETCIRDRIKDYFVILAVFQVF